MFIGFYRLNNQEFFDIYYNNIYGWKEWHKNTFSPDCEDITILNFTIKGKNYTERKEAAAQLAKDWQNYFAGLSWSYGEIAEIETFFEKIGKRFGLLKEFRENCII